MALLATTGCRYSEDRDCDRFAEMEARCELSPNGTPRGHQLATLVCTEAGTHGKDWLSELQAQQTRCAQNSTSCDMYQDCKLESARY